MVLVDSKVESLTPSVNAPEVLSTYVDACEWLEYKLGQMGCYYVGSKHSNS